MHLVAGLLSVQGAGNGTFAVYKRATANAATLYSDVYGTAYSGGLSLDSNGGTTVYVDEPVDVAVYSSTGVPVRQWTEMVSESNVEVISTAFTGTDYVTGQSGVNRPTTLEAAFLTWITSAGEPDWNAKVDGFKTTLQVALNNRLSAFNPMTYGALADGTHDDTVAIQSAISAANAAGGGIVWFPWGASGIYLITQAITMYDNVHLWSCGADISIDDAMENTLDFTGCSGTVPSVVQGLRLIAHQANTGGCVMASATTPVIARDCVLGGTNTKGYCVFMAGTSKVYLDKTQLIVGASTSAHAVYTVSAGDLLSMTDCTATGPANAYGPSPAMFTADHIQVKGLTVTLNTTVGTATTVFAPNGPTNVALNGSVTGSTFTMSGASVTSVVFNLGKLSATAAFNESNNGVSTFILWTGTNLIVEAPVHLGSRHRVKYITATAGGANTNVPTDQYDTVIVTFGAAFNIGDQQTWLFAPLGSECTVVHYNSYAGANNCANAIVHVNGPSTDVTATMGAQYKQECRRARAVLTAHNNVNVWMLEASVGANFF